VLFVDAERLHLDVRRLRRRRSGVLFVDAERLHLDVRRLRRRRSGVLFVDAERLHLDVRRLRRRRSYLRFLDPRRDGNCLFFRFGFCTLTGTPSILIGDLTERALSNSM
jgi:hypothetical protein